MTKVLEKAFERAARLPEEDQDALAEIKFKKVHSVDPIYLARVAIRWRALGTKIDDTMVRF